MNTAAPRPSAVSRTSPRRDHHRRSNHEASALPAREASYSIAPPRIGLCRTSAPIGQRKDCRMTHPITPPASLCILRLSAIGDTCHVVPVVRTLQRLWPTTRLTWIIGRTEARLMTLLPNIEFITIDKRAGLATVRALLSALRGRRFDVLLHLQLSLRASLASLAVRSQLRLGFDRARARELQWLFTNASIAPRTDEHVLDSFQGFLTALGIEPGALEWNLPFTATVCVCCCVAAARGSNARWARPSSAMPACRWSIRSAAIPCRRCSRCSRAPACCCRRIRAPCTWPPWWPDRKSTRLNSRHL